MFVRKKKNRSGTTSIIVAEKRQGELKELKTIGISSNNEEIEKLCQEAKVRQISRLFDDDFWGNLK
jgi:hypothetical protein